MNGPSSIGDRAKILMVDDRPENLLALEAILQGLGHELIRASSGEEALKVLLTTDVAIIRAIAGMVPAGKTELEPKLHAVQRLTAVSRRPGEWSIALFQTTPAQLHGRPEAVAALTAELDAVRAG